VKTAGMDVVEYFLLEELGGQEDDWMMMHSLAFCSGYHYMRIEDRIA
jgi:hypothetical protein